MATEQVQAIIQFLRRIAATGGVACNTDAQLLSRFVTTRDESAFAALVQRHGPMVFGVCRRVLQNTHDAEDAYQATFLVLAQKANGLADPETLGNWLYGVAYRTALKARAAAVKRRAQEIQPVVVGTERGPVAELLVKEIRLLLDEELNRLPPKYRTAFVLCCLEGHTHEEAAQALGCPRKTITTRLTRARERLHRRLVRRGLSLASTTFAALLSQKSLTAAGLPIPDAALTARAAIQFVTNAAITTGTVSAPVVALAQGVLTSMTFTKAKMTIAVLLTVAVFGSSAGLLVVHAFPRGKDEQQVAGPRAGEQGNSVQEKGLTNADQGKKERIGHEVLAMLVSQGKTISNQGKEGATNSHQGKTEKSVHEVLAILEGQGITNSNQAKKEKSDKELLQGTWVEESRGADAKKVAEGEGWKLVFDEDKVTWTVKGKDHQGTFTVDAERKPKEIDLTLADPTLILTGIYELKGDTLKTLWRENDRGGLPNTFDAKEGVLIVFKKKKKE